MGFAPRSTLLAINGKVVSERCRLLSTCLVGSRRGTPPTRSLDSGRTYCDLDHNESFGRMLFFLFFIAICRGLPAPILALACHFILVIFVAGTNPEGFLKTK